MSSTADWPATWTGNWVSADGKVVTIELDGLAPIVTVRPSVDLAPYTSARLLGGGAKAIERLTAACHMDNTARYLEIEAGTPGVGPSYRLYAVTGSPASWLPAASDLSVEHVVLLPNTVIGLYDDYDDDLGVPWAYPLLPMSRQRHLSG